jgi:hypothetical protein
MEVQGYNVVCSRRRSHVSVINATMTGGKMSVSMYLMAADDLVQFLTAGNSAMTATKQTGTRENAAAMKVGMCARKGPIPRR